MKIKPLSQRQKRLYRQQLRRRSTTDKRYYINAMSWINFIGVLK